MSELKKVIDAKKEFGETGSGQAREFIYKQLRRDAIISGAPILLIIALLLAKCAGFI